MKKKNKSGMRLVSMIIRLFRSRREKEISELIKNISEFETHLDFDKSQYVSKENLFDYLLLNPAGYVDEASKILESPIADKYYKMGYLTKGVNENMRAQYRLTSFGQGQIENARTLTILK